MRPDSFFHTCCLLQSDTLWLGPCHRSLWSLLHSLPSQTNLCDFRGSVIYSLISAVLMANLVVLFRANDMALAG